MDDFITLNPIDECAKMEINRITRNEVILRHGHIAITNYRLGDNEAFEKSLSKWDAMYYRYVMMGGYYVKRLREFRINRGYDLNRLKYYFPKHYYRIDNDAYPSDNLDVKLLVPPRDDFQKVAITFMACQGEYKENLYFTQQMIDMPTGKGKAQPDDTLIPTPTGWKRLDELKVGDEVFNRHGKPVPILGIYPQDGLQETYEVTLSDGRKTRCNLDHLWLVHSNTRKNPVVLSLRQILSNYAVISGGHNSHKYSISLPGPVQYESRDVSVDPYILGVLLGNGCLKESPLTISSGTFLIPLEVGRILDCKTNMRRYGNYSHMFYLKEDKIEKDRPKRILTREYLKDYPELIGCMSGDKHIPDDYKYNSIEVRRAVLQGLMDTDGYIDSEKYRVSYTTISTRLKDDIVELVRSLGYGVSVTEDLRHEKYSTGRCYHIHIICPDDEKQDLFRANSRSLKLAKRAASYKTKVSRDTLRITYIRQVESTTQRCILIDDPEHVYITENFVPTHNTYLGTASAAVWSGGCVVFIPIGKLLPQWRESFLDYTSFTKGEIMIVKGSDKCEKIRKGEYPDTKVFLFSTETFNSYHDRYGDLKTIEMLKKTRAHIKIVDEVHRNMGICSKIEALSNFHINYYMSASPGRADRKEDRIFELSYLNIPKFGSDFMRESEKHINIIIKKYNFEPTNDQIRLMYNPKVGLNGRSYEKVLTTAPMIQRESFDQSLRVMFNWSKSLLVKGNKILVLTNTIAGTEYVKRIAEEFFPGEAESYYSSKSKDEKEETLKKTVIIATEGSLGTGADIKGIQHVYNIITYSNKIGAVQYPGRGRQMNDGTPIIYVEFVNMTYCKTYNQYLARKPYLVEVAKDRKIRVVS